MRFCAAGLLIILLSFVGNSTAFAQRSSEDAQELSPGAVPAPLVLQEGLGRTSARPNFANYNALEAFIDGVVESAMAKDHIAGVSLAVVKDGAPVLEKGYGRAGDGRMVKADETLFRLGSISKTFTWTAIMQLVEADQIYLDDPINARLPEPLRMPVHPSGPILLRHLMTHSPGLEDTALGHLFVDRPDRVLSLSEYLQRYRPKQVRPAGHHIAYSNYGSALAGAMVEQVASRNFASYVDENILQPLAMDNSTFGEPIPPDMADARGLYDPMDVLLQSKLSKGFFYHNGRLEPQAFEYISQIAPAGSFSSTARDMARYMLMHLGAGRYENAMVLREETAMRMRQPLLRNGDGLPGFSYGFMEYALPKGYRGIGHAGSTLFFQSNMVMVPDLGIGIFISTNTNTGAELAFRLPDLIVERFFAPSDASSPFGAREPDSETLAETGADELSGFYLSLRRPFTLVESLFVAVNGLNHVEVLDDGAQIIISNAAEQRLFNRIAPLRYKADDGPDIIGFMRDGEDGAIRFLSDPHGIAISERVSYLETPAWFAVSGVLIIATSIGILAGSWRRRGQNINQSRQEFLSAQLMPVMAIIWLGFVLFFAYAALRMSADIRYAVYEFPPLSLKIALLFGVLGLIVTVLGLFGLWPVWRFKSWPLWRQVRHSVAVLIALGFVLTLVHWNAIGFQYF